MAKSTNELREIDLRNVHFQKGEPSWSGNRLINAFDTETHDGTVFMLSYAIADDMVGVRHSGTKNGITSLDATTILDIITHRACRSAINVWFNLNFDADVLLSEILNRKQMKQLTVEDYTETTVDGIEYQIKYVRDKFLLITDEHGNNYYHYDISQFLYGSLNKASKEWLGKEKKEGIDTSKFSNGEYVLENYDKIREYAKKDALLTQEIAQTVINEAESLDIPFGKPFSTGYLSAEYLRANMDYKPKIGKIDYQKDFWKAYHGGRFEVFERGDIGDTVVPDINSAYPAIMSELPDPNTLVWEHPQRTNKEFGMDANPTYQRIKNADYGVVTAEITTNPHKKIQPFAHKMDGTVKFPILTETEKTVLKDIFVFAVENGYIKHYDIKEAWLGYEKEDTSYPFRFMKDLYGQRKVYEDFEDKAKKGQLLKIVLNSGYGKTCQTTEKKKVVPESELSELLEEDHIKQYPIEYLSKNQRKYLGENDKIIRELQAGRRFNPFFASYITGLTRLELHKQVVNYGLEDALIMYATDSIMLRKKPYEKSNFDDLIQTPDKSISDKQKFKQQAKESLGKWDFDFKGDAFVVGSGIYQVKFQECNNPSCEHYETTKCDNPKHYVYMKTRGFNEKNVDRTLKQLAKDNPEGIEVENSRPLTMAEVLIDPTRGNIGEFIDSEDGKKTIQADFDSSRLWKRENPNFHDLLEGSEKSKPIDLVKRASKDENIIRKERFGEKAKA